jgi:cytochrome b561
MSPQLTQRYDRVAMALHWLLGALLLAEMVFGLLLDEMAPRGTPARGATINLHKSIGLLLLILTLARLAWRLRHRPPAWPAAMALRQQRAAAAVHRCLYGLMLLLPLSAWLGSNVSKHGIKFFGLVLPPWGPDLPQLYALLNRLHSASAYLLLALIAGHVLAALKHALLDRDGTLGRIWPGAARS